MNKNLNLMFGKKCFSVSFLDNNLEKGIEGPVYLSHTSKNPDYIFELGYQGNGNEGKDWEVLHFKGEKWLFRKMSNNGGMVLFPKNNNISSGIRIMGFLYGMFYRYEQNNGNNNSFMIHAAGLQRKQKGFIFAGKSGAGKTTVSKLSLDEAELLSDDSIMVTEENAEFYISQVPIHTGLAELNDKLIPLSSIFLLVKDKKNSLRKLGGSEIAERIMDNILYVNLSENLRLKDFYAIKLRFLSAVCARVPIYELRFTKDNRFWKEIERFGLL
ncbi:MAG: hypothetical protein E3K37_05110 [Candidatus Kuenenia sp.]|nr:hypothetical protein [Candidatus Kuenenia hertensis]